MLGCSRTHFWARIGNTYQERVVIPLKALGSMNFNELGKAKSLESLIIFLKPEIDSTISSILKPFEINMYYTKGIWPYQLMMKHLMFSKNENYVFPIYNSNFFNFQTKIKEKEFSLWKKKQNPNSSIHFIHINGAKSDKQILNNMVWEKLKKLMFI